MTQDTRRLVRPDGSFDREAAIDRAEELRRSETRAILIDFVGQIARAVRRAAEGYAAKSPSTPERPHH